LEFSSSVGFIHNETGSFPGIKRPVLDPDHPPPT